MSNGIIVRPIPLTAAQVTAAAPFGIDAAFPAANLVDAQPKTVLQTLQWPSGGSNVRIDIDLLGDTSLDTLAVLFTNLSLAATWTAFATTSAVGTATIEDAGNMVFAATAFGMPETTFTPRRFGLWTGAPISRRYIRIYLYDTAANAERKIRAGIVMIGQKLAPEFNYELGSGRKLEDQSTVRILPGGESAPERGGKTPVFRATWSNLKEAEWDQLWLILNGVGTGTPLLIVEDPDATAGQAERIHYGLLTGLDFNERQQLDKQRIDLTIREMT